MGATKISLGTPITPTGTEYVPLGNGSSKVIATAQSIGNLGLGNSFTKFTGPTTSTKTFTLPDRNATLLYDGGPLGTPDTVGTIITETWANLSNWTNVGTATFSVASNILTVNGGSPGSAALTNYIRQSNYGVSNIEDFIINADITVGTIGANSFGVGFGIQSQNATYLFSTNIGILLDSTNKGKIAFYLDGSTTNSVITASTLTVNSSDQLNIKIRRSKNRFYVTLTNNTTNPGAAITTSYEYGLGYQSSQNAIPGDFQYAIYALGGTHTVSNTYSVISRVQKNKNVILGDSFITGLYAGDNSNRTVEILNNRYGNWIANASPGIKVEHINATEVLASSPPKIVISIGYNNLNASETPSAIMTKIATLVSSLTGYTMGTNLFITTLKASNSLDVTPLNALIRSTYPTGVIDIYYASWSGSGTTANANLVSPDGIHYNTRWFIIEADIYENYFGLKNVSTLNNVTSPYFTAKNGFVGIGNYNSHNNPSNQLDVINSNNSQISFGSSTTALTKGFLTCTQAGYVFLSSDADVVNGNWIARAANTGVFGFDGTTSALVGYLNTGLTIGNSFTPTQIWTLNATGLGVGTSSTAPTHRITAVHTGGASQIRFGNSVSNLGGYITYTGSDVVFATAEYNGVNWTARATTGALVGSFGSSVNFWVDSGLTSGNTYTPTVRATIDTNSFITGSTLSAVYRTTNGGSNVTAAVMLDPASSVTSGVGYIFSTADGLGFTQGNGTRRILFGAIKGVNLTTTAGSEVGDLGFFTQTAGGAAAQRLQIGATAVTFSDAVNLVFNTSTGSKIGTATTQKIGFWNATPVVQPASTGTTTSGFTANSSANTVFAESTFTGNTGATAYTISDIVKNLKTAGILAA